MRLTWARVSSPQADQEWSPRQTKAALCAARWQERNPGAPCVRRVLRFASSISRPIAACGPLPARGVAGRTGWSARIVRLDPRRRRAAVCLSSCRHQSTATVGSAAERPVADATRQFAAISGRRWRAVRADDDSERAGAARWRGRGELPVRGVRRDGCRGQGRPGGSPGRHGTAAGTAAPEPGRSGGRLLRRDRLETRRRTRPTGPYTRSLAARRPTPPRCGGSTGSWHPSTARTARRTTAAPTGAPTSGSMRVSTTAPWAGARAATST